ncbi:MAG: protein-glutamate O-methyltransferase CheR [Deltaproteobacteria bacterium]|nr:protein-glutamate O-methyltransferase CheR [Deltaproteobacteria bacterium]
MVGDEKLYLIENNLSQLVVESGCASFRDFYFKAKNDRRSGLRDKIVDAMTNNETLWFRDGVPWVVFEEAILPVMAEWLKTKKKPRMRLWSCACSTGQEPYSVAMIIDRFCKSYQGKGVDKTQFEIIGTDISPTVLFKAISGRYDSLAVSRGLTPEIKQKYFTEDGQSWILNEDIRRMVTFKQFNLQDNFISLGKFNLVFCRNVAIYFSTEFKKQLFAKIANTLKPDGFFMVGSSESLRGYSEDFVSKDHKRGIYYQAKP